MATREVLVDYGIDFSETAPVKSAVQEADDALALSIRGTSILTVSDTFDGPVVTCTVTTSDDAEEAGRIVQRVSDQLTLMEEARFKLTRPLDQAKAGIMDLFRPKRDLGTLIVGAAKEALVRYHQARKFEREQQQREMEEAAMREAEASAVEDRAVAIDEAIFSGNLALADQLQNGPAPAVTVDPVNMPAPIRRAALIPSTAGVSVRESWTYEIVDLDKLRREAPEYTIANPQMLAAAAKSLKGNANIPGVRVFAQETVARKSRRV